MTMNAEILNNMIKKNEENIVTTTGEQFTFQVDDIYRVSFSTNDNGNYSVSIEGENYLNFEQLKLEYDTKAFENLIYQLLRDGNTNEAKSVLNEFKHYSSPLIDKWRKSLFVLGKKRNLNASLDVDEIKKDSKLLRKYKNIFPSKWIALSSNKIIASNSDLSELKNEVKSLKLNDDITFLKL